jgi:hypothetical protein
MYVPVTVSPSSPARIDLIKVPFDSAVTFHLIGQLVTLELGNAIFPSKISL